MSEDCQSILSFGDYSENSNNANDVVNASPFSSWSKEQDLALKEIMTTPNEKIDWKNSSKKCTSDKTRPLTHRLKKDHPTELIKGPWTYEEDRKLLKWIQSEGPCKWSLCSDTIPGRSGKQCRERWFNALNPEVKKGEWDVEEDYKIYFLYSQYGGKWSQIANFFRDRTENSIKNRFYSSLRKIYTEKIKADKDEVQSTNGSRQGIGIGELIKFFPQAIETTKVKLQKIKGMNQTQFQEYLIQLKKEIEKIYNSQILKQKKSKKKMKVKFDINNSSMSQEIKSTTSKGGESRYRNIPNGLNGISDDKNTKGDESAVTISDSNSDLEEAYKDSKTNGSEMQSKKEKNLRNQMSNQFSRGQKTLYINCNFNVNNNIGQGQQSEVNRTLDYKKDIYYYLLEELEDLEAVMNSAKSELLAITKAKKQVEI